MTDPSPASNAATPYGSPAAAADATRPATVTAAFWLFIAAAALSLVSLVVTIVSFDSIKQQALDQVEAQDQTGVLPEGSMEAILNATFGASIAFALIGTALYILFAMFIRRGAGWARWVLLAFAAMAIFGIIGQYGIGAALFLCLALGTVLVFLPKSREYFAAVRANKTIGRRPAF